MFQIQQNIKIKYVQHDYRNNESKKLTKHISCECKYRFDGRKCNLDRWRNNGKCQCEC